MKRGRWLSDDRRDEPSDEELGIKPIIDPGGLVFCVFVFVVGFLLGLMF
jgi:hypothetical protein